MLDKLNTKYINFRVFWATRCTYHISFSNQNNKPPEEENNLRMATALAAATISADDTVATTALVAYLRSEADISEQKAASLRAQADALASTYNIADLERYGE